MERAAAGSGDRGGRPATTSAHRIAAAAQELFVERGFDAVSVGDITAAVGISRRTFFRYFATKADVLWVESAAELDRFRAALAAADPDEPVPRALTRAVLAALVWSDADEQWARHRAALLSTEPAVAAQVAVVLGQWRELVVAHVRHAGPGVGELRARVLGHGLVGGLLAAHEQWVAEPGSDLHALLTAALEMALPAGA